LSYVASLRDFLEPFPLGRLRAAFDGLGLLLPLTLLIAVALTFATGAPAYEQFASAPAAVHFAIQWLLLYCLIYLTPLPFIVLAFNLAPARGWRRAITLTGIFCGYAAISITVSRAHARHDVLGVVFIIVALLTVLEFRHRAARSAGQLIMQQVQAADLDSKLNQAQLRLLQAQMEPHFLFNTLANVRRLACDDTQGAAEMLSNLIHYIEAALPHARADRTTLAKEQALIDAYLRIHQIRMGSRLSYKISIPQTVSGAEIPTMMLLTLVENAIKHGINPLTQGGHIRITAQRAGSSLEVAVADTGRGMPTTGVSGVGAGLANTRARLNLLYGEGAQLLLAHGSARGLTVTIRLPWRA
jgi:sensor histidine kinase YesM